MVVNGLMITKIEQLDVPEVAVDAVDVVHCQDNCCICDKIDLAEQDSQWRYLPFVTWPLYWTTEQLNE